MKKKPISELTAEEKRKINKDPLRVRSFPERASIGLSRVFSQPSLVKELGQKFINRKIIDPKHKRRLNEYAQYTVSLEEGISKAAQVSVSEVKKILAEKELECTFIDAQKLGTEKGIPYLVAGGFVQLCYVLCRLHKPEVALETGVAYGWVSVFILTALEKNNKGRLYSIDLPAFAVGSSKWSGAMVPDRLKANWSMHIGPQAKILPDLLSEIPQVDFFHYDSDKTYQGMITTFRLVWSRMSSHGVMISDDLDNDAFLDFAESEGLQPIIVIKPTDKQRVGILIHP
jgi:predicted O-methyltransferase YrrM